jgi:hypothetical protein
METNRAKPTQSLFIDASEAAAILGIVKRSFERLAKRNPQRLRILGFGYHTNTRAGKKVHWLRSDVMAFASIYRSDDYKPETEERARPGARHQDKTLYQM